MLFNYPLVIFACSVIVLWLAAQAGDAMHRRRPLREDERDDFSVVEAATLTLLGLIIGFSFSMATTRYDLRKNYEEAEANAIGTEYVRTGLLPPAVGAPLRAQLKKYLHLRIAFYQTRSGPDLDKINADTNQLQSEMWSAVEAPALANQTPIIGLAVSGMNDVLNSQGYTQAAWWNRIPKAAWVLMVLIAFCSNFLVGYGSRGPHIQRSLILILPLVISLAFLLIADIDSPRGGMIHVAPQNLMSLSHSLPQARP